jgi:hypothetical protein
MIFPFRLRPATRPKGLENQRKSARCENGGFRLDLLGDFRECRGYQHRIPRPRRLCQPRLARGFGFLGLGFSRQLTTRRGDRIAAPPGSLHQLLKSVEKFIEAAGTIPPAAQSGMWRIQAAAVPACLDSRCCRMRSNCRRSRSSKSFCACSRASSVGIPASLPSRLRRMSPRAMARR